MEISEQGPEIIPPTFDQRKAGPRTRFALPVRIGKRISIHLLSLSIYRRLFTDVEGNDDSEIGISIELR
jgi:hypothetical protein